MSTVGQISNGESGLSVRTKLNLVIDRTTVFDTAANFTSNNPTLNTGQLAIDTDDLLTTPKFKIGDGVTAWNTLPYFSSSGVQSVTGPNVDNTDTSNPVVNTPTLSDVLLSSPSASNLNYATIYGPANKGAFSADLSTMLMYWIEAGMLSTSSVSQGSAKLYGSGGGNQGTVEANATGNTFANTIKNLFDSPLHEFNNIVKLTGLTPSQIVETDASKNLVSVAKATGYNLPLGTTAGTVLEGDRITQTITDGVTDKVPSEDAVFNMFKNHRQIYSSIRITQDSATITGTTSETLLASTLVPANTFSVDDVINLEIRCKRASPTGSTSHRIKINTSNSLIGATLAGIVTNNNAVLMPTFSRNLVIKSSTNTEVMGTSATFSTDVGSITSAISSININWTIDQYIIISVQPSASAETNILSYLLIERR